MTMVFVCLFFAVLCAIGGWAASDWSASIGVIIFCLLASSLYIYEITKVVEYKTEIIRPTILLKDAENGTTHWKAVNKAYNALESNE